MATRYFDLNIQEFLESWQVRDALRELIANAIDEATLSGTESPEIVKRGQAWVIRDYGRGLRHLHLTQAESAEKLNHSNNVIGKFGVGLKDALATLYRLNISTRIETSCDLFTLQMRAKESFSDTETLHARVESSSGRIDRGTEFHLLGVQDAQMREAQAFFRRFRDHRVLENTRWGTVLSAPARGKAAIYINGVRVATEDNFLFSYDITSLTKTMRTALNRERAHVGRNAYAERVKQILKGCRSKDVAEALADDVGRISYGTNRDEVTWAEVSFHACRILNSLDDVLFITAGEAEQDANAVDLARRSGRKIVYVTDSLRSRLRGATDLAGRPIRDLDLEHREWIESFEFQFVEPAALSRNEADVYAYTDEIAALMGLEIEDVAEVLISETMAPERGNPVATLGLWSPQDKRIIVHRSQLKSLPKYAGVLLHELAHATSGHSDVTREFESTLTEYLGQVARVCLVRGAPRKRRDNEDRQ